MSNWLGSWVEREIGIQLTPVSGRDVRAMTGLAIRRNPRRAHLVVSRVLGKHIPGSPKTIRSAASDLAALVVETLREPAGSLVVIGFAETAAALGHCVADALTDSYYLHSTRIESSLTITRFSEPHSHASEHFIAPADPDALRRAQTIVLVDDEISTGTTARNAIASLRETTGCTTFVLATLLDTRDAVVRESLRADLAAEGITITTVALSTATITLPADVVNRAEPHVVGVVRRPGPHDGVPQIDYVTAEWTPGVPLDGRAGISAQQRSQYDAAAVVVVRQLEELLPPGPVTVVGTEEFMHLPLLLAEHLEAQGREVVYGSTTRSPAVVIDEDEYALRTVIEFQSTVGDYGSTERYLYNVALGRGEASNRRTIVLCGRTEVGVAESLLVGLGTAADRIVCVFFGEVSR